MNEELEINEPENPDKYYYTWEKTEINGKLGKAKLKVWTSDIDKKEHRKIVSFEEYR